ncbi:hypothetical protein A2U01_0013850 [Trifolium medium]|uniref:Uncharacterized protein n=1 Tax=Trifolium medium TaxID=97028 RepID=A0A392N327_9FABA|nr:hypothetical protein [Trifolium medium]
MKQSNTTQKAVVPLKPISRGEMQIQLVSQQTTGRTIWTGVVRVTIVSHHTTQGRSYIFKEAAE